MTTMLPLCSSKALVSVIYYNLDQPSAVVRPWLWLKYAYYLVCRWLNVPAKQLVTWQLWCELISRDMQMQSVMMVNTKLKNYIYLHHLISHGHCLLVCFVTNYPNIHFDFLKLFKN